MEPSTTIYLCVTGCDFVDFQFMFVSRDPLLVGNKDLKYYLRKSCVKKRITSLMLPTKFWVIKGLLYNF